MSEREVVIVDAVRTAFGRMGGTLKDIFASNLASIGIRGLLDKTGIQGKAHVDSVFLGTALGCSHSGNPARWAVLDSGLGYETSASYVEMQCGSAIDSINHAAWKILAGWVSAVMLPPVLDGFHLGRWTSLTGLYLVLARAAILLLPAFRRKIVSKNSLRSHLSGLDGTVTVWS